MKRCRLWLATAAAAAGLPFAANAQPVNDDCASAIDVGALPAQVTEDTTLATLDVPTDDCAVTITAPGVWYSVAGTGFDMTASMCIPVGTGTGSNASYDTKLHVYSGDCTTQVCEGANDDACPGAASEVTWTSTMGTTYLILVSGFDTNVGTFTLDVTTAGPPPIGACCNTDGTCTDGQTQEDCEAAGGTYQGDSVLCFDVVTCNGACCAPDGSCTDVSADACASSGGVFQGAGTDCGSVVCPLVPANDLCADAIDVGMLPAQVSGDTTNATPDVLADCGTTITAPGVWYSVTGTGNTITASLCTIVGTGEGPNASYDTKLSVFCNDCAVPQCVGGNDDDCGLGSRFSWCSASGQTYFILVHGFLDTAGTFTMDITDDGVPCMDAVICTPGACCLCDGTCFVTTSDDCAAQGGTFLGDPDCLGAVCPTAPANDDAMMPEILTVDTLVGNNVVSGTLVCATGTDLSSCNTDTNDVWYVASTMAATGYDIAISNNSGTVTVSVFDDGLGTTEFACGTNGAAFTSAGGTLFIRVAAETGETFDIEMNEIVPTGSCTLADVCMTCTIETEADCNSLGGTWGGAESTCPPALATGACCLPSLCIVTCEIDCTGMGGTYLGDGEACGNGFGGTEGMGDWTLTVNDDAGGDTGTWVDWSVVINGTTYASAALNLPIDDTLTNPNVDIINVPDMGTVTTVEVNFTAAHTWAADLEITLTGPTGVSVLLADDNGTGGANLGDGTDGSAASALTYTFSDAGVGTWTDGGDPVAAGVYMALGSLNAGPLGSCATGACVVASTCNDNCTITTSADCMAQGGMFLGVQTECPAADPTGACCVAGTGCVVTCAADCTALGGSYFGDDTDCASNTGACCLVDSCVITCADDCAALAGTYLGNGTDCGSPGFGGTEGMGDWTLTVNDDAGGDTGTWVDWSVVINGTTYASAALNLPIDDTLTNPNVDIINVPDMGTVTTVEVNFTAAHTWAADLEITLTGPTGVSVLLADDNGTGGANLGDGTDGSAASALTYTFSDAGVGTWTDGGDPVAAGVYMALGSLNAGPLGSCAEGACVVASDCNDNCTITSADACMALGGMYLGDQTACPAPDANGACCLGDGSCIETCANDCSLLGGSYVGDGTTCPTGDAGYGGTDSLGDWTLTIVDDAGGDDGTWADWSLNINGTTYSSAALGLAITNGTGNEQMDTISVPDSASITNIDVTFTVTHTFAADLEVSLTGPTGLTRNITFDNGGGNDLDGSYTFSDSALEDWNGPGVSPLPAGTYLPDQSLSTSLEDPCADTGCLCEFGGDPALVNVEDLLAFLALWFVSDPGADINGGGVDVTDLLDFLSCWFPSNGGPCI